MNPLAGLFALLVFVGLPVLVLAIAAYLSTHDGKRPFRFHVWQMLGVPFRALIPSFLARILSEIRGAAARGETALHQKTVEGTIAESKEWHADLKDMEARLGGLGLSSTTMAEFSNRVDDVQANGESLQAALDVHRQQQEIAAAEELKVKEIERLLVQMRALRMSPDALADVERKLLEAIIHAGQATVASQVIGKYLGSHSAAPGALVQALPDLFGPRAGMIGNRAVLAIAGPSAELGDSSKLVGTSEPPPPFVQDRTPEPTAGVGIADSAPAGPVVSLVKVKANPAAVLDEAKPRRRNASVEGGESRPRRKKSAVEGGQAKPGTKKTTTAKKPK